MEIIKLYPLYRGLVTVVDETDFELVNQFKWSVLDKPDSLTYYAHRRWTEDGKRNFQRLHTLITGWSYVNHIDRNGLNNCRYNLEESDHYRNMRNKVSHRNSASKYKGVQWRNDSNIWRAQLRMSGKLYSLGQFEDEISAALAYDSAAREKFGKNGRYNFPLDGERSAVE